MGPEFPIGLWCPRSCRLTAASSGHRRKIPYLGGEYGASTSVNPDGVDITRNGVLRSLAHLGVLNTLKRFTMPLAKKTRLIEPGGHDYYMHAPETDLFELATRLGDEIKNGQLCGTAHFTGNPERMGVPTYFRRDGVVDCKRHYGRFESGDCVAHQAPDI